MARHQFGNTATSDLWDALEAETGEPVRRIAESWIFQGGFPEVTVGLHAGSGVTLTQRRFLYDGGKPGVAGDDDERWSVPVVVRHDGDGGATLPVLLDGPSASLPLDGGTPAWVNANAGAHGFYRVRYTGALLDGLLDNLDSLSPLERYTVVDDAFAAVLSGSIGAADFVRLVERYDDERDLSVWERIVGALGQVDRLALGDAGT